MMTRLLLRFFFNFNDKLKIGLSVEFEKCVFLFV
jgi:hypothetical protein